MNKVCRDRGDRLAITNNQHAPDRYSKVYLIQDAICKLYGRDSPWVTNHHPFFLTTTATFLKKETKKLQPFHDKQLQKAPLPLQK